MRELEAKKWQESPDILGYSSWVKLRDRPTFYVSGRSIPAKIHQRSKSRSILLVQDHWLDAFNMPVTMEIHVDRIYDCAVDLYINIPEVRLAPLRSLNQP